MSQVYGGRLIELARKKSTKYQLQQKLDEVRNLQKENKSLKEISEILKIPLRTIEFYSKKIYNEDRDKWANMEKESLEGRAYIIKSYYEKGTEMCQQIMDDEKKSPKDRIDAFKTLIACQNNIYNMLRESPIRFKVTDTNLSKLEDKSQ